MLESRDARADRAARSSFRAGCRLIVVLATLAACGGEFGGGDDSVAVADPPPPGATAPDQPAPDTGVVPPVLPGVAGAPVNPPTVTEFLRFVEAQRAPDATQAMGIRTADGLRLLADAIESIAGRDTAHRSSVAPHVADLRARADSMRRAVPADDAALAVGAFVIASDLLRALQAQGQPTLTDRAAEARQAALAMRVDRPLSSQAGEVQRFFERAAAALRGLVGAPTI